MFVIWALLTVIAVIFSDTSGYTSEKVKVTTTSQFNLSHSEVHVHGEGQQPPEGRNLAVIAELLMSVHCLVNDCRNIPKRAEYCCSRNFNEQCCQFSPGVVFGPQLPPWAAPPIIDRVPNVPQPYAPPQIPAAVPAVPAVLPPILPLATLRPPITRPRPPLTPPRLPITPPYGSPLPPPYGSPPYGQHSPLGLDALYKPGECPSTRTRRYRGGSSRYQEDTTNSLDWSRPTCSFDLECPGAEKCCHALLQRDLYTMRCRYPSRGSRQYY